MHLLTSCSVSNSGKIVRILTCCCGVLHLAAFQELMSCDRCKANKIYAGKDMYKVK